MKIDGDINTNRQMNLFGDEQEDVRPVKNKRSGKQQTKIAAEVSRQIELKDGSDKLSIPIGRKPIFVVDEAIRNKYPFIRHQPASLMDYRNIVDIIVRDGNNEYWIGFDRHKNEILPGSFEKKIPDHLKESVTEYIEHLKVI